MDCGQQHHVRSKGLDGTDLAMSQRLKAAAAAPGELTAQSTSPKLTIYRLSLVSVLRGDAKVAGTVTFEQESESAPTTITWDISGNDPNAERGFHIHTFGDNTNGCTSAGPHFNPHGKTHGAPSDAARHVGDLGNIKTDAQGNAKGSVQDSHVKLIGPHSVIGVRATHKLSSTARSGNRAFANIAFPAHRRCPRRHRRPRQGRQRGVPQDWQRWSPSRLR